MFRTLILLFLVFSFNVSAEFIPERANKYKRDLIRFAQHYYGIEAPVPVFAAQFHKESTWDYMAKSPFADGLAQFTPETAEDVSKKYPELVANEPLNPIWAIKALLLYDLDLKTQVDAIDECNDWAFTLAMYNGGPGWIWREKNLAEANGVDRNTYWDAVENFNAGRRASAKAENQGYPRKILLVLQELYLNEGSWGFSDICLTIEGEFEEEVVEVITGEIEVVEEVNEGESTNQEDSQPQSKPKKDNGDSKSLWQRFLDLF